MMKIYRLIRDKGRIWHGILQELMECVFAIDDKVDQLVEISEQRICLTCLDSALNH